MESLNMCPRSSMQVVDIRRCVTVIDVYIIDILYNFEVSVTQSVVSLCFLFPAIVRL